MNITTSKKAVIAQSVLLSLTGTQYSLRTLASLAKEAGASERDTLDVINGMGLQTKRRRSDGATLYGIAGRVSGSDVVHTPVATATVATSEAHVDERHEEPAHVQPAAAGTSRLNDAKGKIVVALEDRRFTLRSRKALKQAGNVSDYELDAILRDLNVMQRSGYIGLRSRN